MSNIAVIGAGAWGTALALQAERAGNRVALVARDAASASTMKARGKAVGCPGTCFPSRSTYETTFRVMPICCCGLFRPNISAPRSRGCGPNVVPSLCAPKALKRTRICCRWKWSATYRPARPLAVLTGPNFAHEVAKGLPTAAVVASADSSLREQVRVMLGTPTFRLYGNDDPIGAQLGGAAKNVIAIAAGAVIGAGLGENARAALVTRGLSELRRLAVALGGTG